jgi:hypothetical protein
LTTPRHRSNVRATLVTTGVPRMVTAGRIVTQLALPMHMTSAV